MTAWTWYADWCFETWQHSLSRMQRWCMQKKKKNLRQSPADIGWHFEVAAETQEAGHFLSLPLLVRSFPNCAPPSTSSRNVTGTHGNFAAAHLACDFQECGLLFVFNNGSVLGKCKGGFVVASCSRLHLKIYFTVYNRGRRKECVCVCAEICVCLC